MTTRRRVLLVALAAVACAFATPAASAGAAAEPGPGALSPAFVRALHDPLIALGLGRLPSPVEVEVGEAAQARAERLVQPSSYSLVDEGRVTPVKDQLMHSTCWAFANVAAVESRLMPADPAPDYSEDNMVARSGYGPFPGGYSRYDYGGFDFMAVAYLARWAGPLNEADDGYTYPARSGHASGPVQQHVQGVVMIPGRSHPLDNDLIKQLVVENGALSVGMYWYDPAYSEVSSAGEEHAAYFLDRAYGENHGVTIVGWDDAYPAERFQGADGQPRGPGAFLVRNSWGDGWGESGCFWVSYYDRSFARDQGLGGYGGGVSYSVIEDVGNYSRVYQYDKLGVTDRWGFGDARVWGANRFTAAKTQRIAAAGFYTLASSTSYEVWAGRTLRSLRLRAAGTAALPGYTTVRFDTQLAVTAGKAFVVAVKLVSPGTTHPMAIERPTHGWMAGATAKAGQSYLSRNGSAWIDATKVRGRSNVCLKAFAE